MWTVLWPQQTFTFSGTIPIFPTGASLARIKSPAFGTPRI